MRPRLSSMTRRPGILLCMIYSALIVLAFVIKERTVKDLNSCERTAKRWNNAEPTRG